MYFAEVTVKPTIFCDVMPCSLVQVYRLQINYQLLYTDYYLFIKY